MNPIPKNPTNAIIEAAARIIVARLNFVDFDDRVRDVVKCYEDCDDGYQLAKKLDECCYWDCCMLIVKTLDSMQHEVDRLHDDVMRKWAVENPQQLLPVGTRVKTSFDDGIIIESPHQFCPLKYRVKFDESTFLFWLDEVEVAQ